ncbi:hypothetical protein [Planctobacterium marinum]|uniref:hypothetical protein n=1 Tax=Planctobacterium marinum TaxID=1631968 RepID=UPI001E2A744C|nr:hypothetical protein [Planctobacterium marinum]MCC2608080.1 hypothetical protein [Planctobacterium marinum]
MSNENDNNPEQDISERYRQLDKKSPSNTTDETILNFAKQRIASNGKPRPLMSQHYRWLSVAASVMLVSVIFLSQWQNFTPESVHEIAPDSTAEVLAPVATPEKSVADGQQSLTGVFAEQAVAVPESKARARGKAEALQQSSMSANSLLTMADHAVKPECRYSLDGANPLSDSSLGKYIQGLARQTQQALVTAINSNTPVEKLLAESPALKNVSAMPGFEKHYTHLASQVTDCTATTGPAIE